MLTAPDDLDAIIDALKLRLMQSDSIAPILESLFDHDARLVSAGEECALPEGLGAILASIADQVFGKTGGGVTDAMLVRHPAKQFLHGVCMLRARMTTIVYFEDVQMGAVAILRGPSDVLYSRFSAIPWNKPTPPPAGNLVPRNRTRH